MSRLILRTTVQGLSSLPSTLPLPFSPLSLLKSRSVIHTALVAPLIQIEQMLQLECKSLGANLRLNKFMEVCIRSTRAVSSNRSAISIILILAIKHIACSCIIVLKSWTIANVMQLLISKLLNLSSVIPSYRKVDYKLNQTMKSMNAKQELPLLSYTF